MNSNVFVKFLPEQMKDHELMALFAQFGVIVSAKVMVNPSDGTSLGYGFVRFQREEDALAAVAIMAGHRIGIKSLMCKISDNKYSEPSPNLYIKPLPVDITEEQLAEIFGKFGTIVNTKVFKRKSVENNYIGFVRYTSLASASQAIHEMNGATIAGQDLQLKVTYAEPQSKRALRKPNTVPNSPEQHRRSSRSQPASPSEPNRTFQDTQHNTPYASTTSSYSTQTTPYLLVPNYSPIVLVPVYYAVPTQDSSGTYYQ